ncbi:response regulator [Sphingomonas metalli]|uniref:Response regulator n=1 Tax=Sphingomonas metalli TaxID=1779358 RepID=A0A916SZ38_9SPHN|nr:response regulator [Sphingomonas metalli]GGB22817.1 response regulator [Sphingomonas metalli]
MSKPTLLLIVEDEPVILMHIEETLTEGGFQVIVSHDGDAAFAALSDDRDAPVGIITDVRLGKGPNGWDVARFARERHPSIAVVYVTAESAADWTAYGVPKSVLVPKPFAGAQLITAISGLLNDQASAMTSG